MDMKFVDLSMPSNSMTILNPRALFRSAVHFWVEFKDCKLLSWGQIFSRSFQESLMGEVVI
jgi:hypothetical protein